ncbi:ADP-ribosyltransferase (plasmid) [Enterobacter sp. JS8-1]|uniref:ADP-ribosyltransferase n=1 Tax=Enterobacter sp. JS8-1 TaxID=3411633 RepID=UPI003BA3DB2A
MQKYNTAKVDHIGKDERTVNLYTYSSVSDLTSVGEEIYDYLIVTCNDNWLENPILKYLFENGTDVGGLLNNPAGDFRPSLPCIITEDLNVPCCYSFRRLVVLFTSANSKSTPELLWSAYQSLSLFVGKDKKNKAIYCIDSTLPVEYQLHSLRMAFYSSMSLSAKDSWDNVNIAGCYETIDILSANFETHVKHYDDVWTMTPETQDALAHMQKKTLGITQVSSTGLTDRQHKGINFYTSFGYGPMNSALRKGDIFTEEFIRIQSAIEACSTALHFLGNEVNVTTYRRMNPFEGAEQIYAVGNDVLEAGYTSTSRKDIPYFGSWGLIFDGLLGKDISPYAIFPQEEEILFDKSFNHLVFSVDDGNEDDTMRITSKERILNNYELKSYMV